MKKVTDKAKRRRRSLLLFVSEPHASSYFPAIPQVAPLRSSTMASREGINPLRPYYIPQTGLTDTTPEVMSPSSAQVFGSSARDFMPDIDYADYLESSPSVADWIRDALNRAFVRYSRVLVGQPFDVAKTILQVYVVPDAAEEHPGRKSIPGNGSSAYESVWLSFFPGPSGGGGN